MQINWHMPEAMTQPSDTGPARHYWLAVASANHVALGREQGFMQVCHGKPAPLRRIHAGDGVVYYSPTATFGQKDTLRAFTAAGVVTSKTPYQAQMGEHFFPWRHDVRWYVTTPAPIAPLRTQLELTVGKTNWGYSLRFGLVRISPQDFAHILLHMQASSTLENTPL